jgi:hypothetical protein
MRALGSPVPLLSALLLACGGMSACSAPRPAAPASPGGAEAASAAAPEAPPGAPPGAPEAAPINPLDAALRDALAGGSREGLRIDAECRRPDGSYPSATVFGNGVAIWNRERQARLPEDEVRGLLEAFRSAGFAAMEDTYGGTGAPANPPARTPADPPGSGHAAAPTLTCAVSLRLGGAAKRVNQLAEGARSEPLARLAAAVLDACEGAGRNGAGAASLTDGLRKIVTGDLPPEVLRIDAHREGDGPAATGWLLTIEGGAVTSRSFQGAAGYGEPRTMRLPPDEVALLARLLVGQGVESLPFNLYADQYTDLSIEVLNRKISVQARRFAGMTAETHGEKQQGFDRAVDFLEALHLRALAEGRPVAP